MPEHVSLSQEEATRLATRACLAAGADEATTKSLVSATLSAAMYGPSVVGFPHFVDYLNSFREGRINCSPRPIRERLFPAYLASDADRGIAQLGFDLAFDDFVEAARTFGLAAFTQKNSYTTGELGYYVRRLAGEGLAGIAATNANAMVTAKPGGPSVYSTNPLAFGFPLASGSKPIIIDQATSATAYVNIVAAAAEGRSIPEGWAVDELGQKTQDPNRALKGSLLPFGGRKGANLALMVEMLSAGISGGPWSLDVPDFTSGSTSPGVGLTVLAIMPGAAGGDRVERASNQSTRLQEHGVFVPGVSSPEYAPAPDEVIMPRSVLDTISRFAGQ